MSKIHFIKAPCHQSTREQGYQLGPDEIKQTYDYEIPVMDFNGSNVQENSDETTICPGYQKLYEYILKYTKEHPDDKIVTIGGDHNISAATVAAMNEKYLKQQSSSKTVSNLKIIWIDKYPDITDSKNLSDLAVASLLGIISPTFVSHKLLLKPEQIIFIGLEDSSDISTLNEYGFQFYTLKKMRSVGIPKILDIIKKFIKDDPVHISYDVKSKFDAKELETIVTHFKDQTVSMDVVEFNPLLGTKNSIKTTKDLIRRALVSCFDIKEKSINVFTEDSEFLIFRPLDQENPEADYGWFILRGLDIPERENIMKKISNDSIVTFNIDGDDYLVAKTTMNEQMKKSYYTCMSINDTVLFPEEKKLMCFELINKIG